MWPEPGCAAVQGPEPEQGSDRGSRPGAELLQQARPPLGSCHPERPQCHQRIPGPESQPGLCPPIFGAAAPFLVDLDTSPASDRLLPKDLPPPSPSWWERVPGSPSSPPARCGRLENTARTEAPARTGSGRQRNTFRRLRARACQRPLGAGEARRPLRGRVLLCHQGEGSLHFAFGNSIGLCLTLPGRPAEALLQNSSAEHF